MTEEQKFAAVEKLMPVLKEFQTKGNATMELDLKFLLKDVYSSINPGVQLDISCSSCIIHYLNILQSWYEREHPNYIKSPHKEDLSLANHIPPEPVKESKIKTTRKNGVRSKTPNTVGNSKS